MRIMGCAPLLLDVAHKMRAPYLALVVFLALGGCSFGLGQPSLKAHDPALRIPAIKRAGVTHDTSAIPALIGALGSDDPAVRFYAGYALEEITGQTLGYVYYAPSPARAAAIRRWRAWYRGVYKPAG